MIRWAKSERDKKEAKWRDTMGISDMSDDFVYQNRNKLLRKAYWGVLRGVVLVIAVIVAMIILWDRMFYM